MDGIVTIELFRKGVGVVPCRVNVVPSGLRISNVLPPITSLSSQPPRLLSNPVSGSQCCQVLRRLPIQIKRVSPTCTPSRNCSKVPWAPYRS